MSFSLNFPGKLSLVQIIGVLLALISAGVMLCNFAEGAIWVIFLGATLFLNIKISSKFRWVLDIFFPLFISCFTLYFVEYIGIVGHGSALDGYWSLWVYMNRLMRNIGGISKRYLTEILLYVAIYFILRALFVPQKAAAIATPSVFFLAAIVDFYVYQFRGEELIAVDFYGARTAISVASGYDFFKIQPFAYILIPYALFIIFTVRLKVEKTVIPWYLRLIIMLILAVSSSYAFYNRFTDYISNHDVYTYNDLPTKGHGFPLNFIMSIFCINPSEPEGYSEEALENSLEFYGIDTDTTAYGDEGDSDTNIIVIMNESFSDFSIYENKIGPLAEDPLDFWHSLKYEQNTITGTAYSSVYGGRTPNSEFEYLTGITTEFLPDGSIPYSLYINDDTYSLASFLSDMGYRTIAVHPMGETGWNRQAVYPLLGFDEIYFKTSLNYSESDMIHGYMSDRCLYQNIIDMLDDTPDGQNTFVFAVTIQNHGGYTGFMTNLDSTSYVGSDVADSEAINNYLSLIRESDDALEWLLDYLSEQDERYVVVMFGDHQPNMTFSTSLTAAGGSAWKVPYMIWTNYTMPENAVYSVDRSIPTSINYLALDTLNAAEIEIPPYFQVISLLREAIPSINSSGYYSLSSKSFIDTEDAADSSEVDALNLYRMYQYNQFFDDGNIWDS